MFLNPVKSKSIISFEDKWSILGKLALVLYQQNKEKETNTVSSINMDAVSQSLIEECIEILLKK